MKIKSLFLAVLLAFTNLSATAGDQIIGYLKNPGLVLTRPGQHIDRVRNGTVEEITTLVQEWIELNPLYKIVTMSPNVTFDQRNGIVYRGVWIVYEKK